MDEYENDPSTWSYVLKEHFDRFIDACWKGFKTYCEDMREKGHENKVDRLMWREYVLWDMQQKHHDEKSQQKRVEA